MSLRRATMAVVLSGGLLAAVLALPASAVAQEPPRTCTEALIPVSDGVRLHAWVSRPGTADPEVRRPVLFMMDSYARGGKPGVGPTNDNACPRVLPDDYVPAYLPTETVDRFALVQVSYRGTGSSEGLFDMTGARTQQDLREAIAWAAAGPWSSGDVVLIGESGTGFVAHHGLREPSVRAAVIFTSCADMYRCFRRGGAYDALADVYLLSTRAGYAAGLRARTALGLMGNPDPVQQQAALAAMDALTKAIDTNDAWWQERSALERLPETRIPVLYTTDLFDIVQPYDALQRTPDAAFNLGMGHLSAGASGSDRYRSLVRSQVDAFVRRHGLGERDLDPGPRVKLVTGVGGYASLRQGRLLVRDEPSWPLPGTAWTRLHLTAGGALSLAAPTTGGEDVIPIVAGPRPDLRTTAFVLGDDMPTDQRDEESTGSTWTTPTLRRDLEVSGPLSLHVWASSTAPDFDWTVRVTDVHPDGRSEWITDGALRARLRRVDPDRSLRAPDGEIVRPWLTYDTSEPVPLDEPVEYRVDVIGTSNVFRAGHRLRLALLPVGGAGLDATRTGGFGALRVLRDPAHPSALIVPVVPDRCGRSRPLNDLEPPVVRCARSLRGALDDTDEPAAAQDGGACASRRRFRVRLGLRRDERLYRAVVTIAGRRRSTVRSARAGTAVVDLRRRARGRVTVRIAVRTRAGRAFTITRRYRPCTTRR